MASAAHPRRDGPGVGVLCPVPDGLSPVHGVGAAGFPRGTARGRGQRGLLPPAATLVFLVFWTFLRHGFDLLLDWLPENLFAFGTGLVGAGVLHLLVMLIPLPVQNPNPESYAQQFALSPAATVVILVVLMPLVEEPLFRGLLFGATRRYSRVLGYVLSTLVFALYCVWQFVYSYGTVDFRYLLLFLQYVPMSLALTWCYDNGGSIWSPIALHMVLNALILASAVLGA